VTQTMETTRATGQAPAVRRGVIMAIGGAEDTSGDGEILEKFVELAGGARARIAIIPAASETPQESGDSYRTLFKELGAGEIKVTQFQTREAAGKETALEPLRWATGVFMTGGDQNRLAEIIIGTPVHDCLRERNAEGQAIAGTSAGAAILASHMICGGDGGASPRKGMVDLSEGLGLLPNTIVDTHFDERGRTGRLLASHATHTDVISVGLDEDTAALIEWDMVMSVVGVGSVMIIDGSAIKSDIEQLEDDDDPVMVNGVEVHTVTSRYTFDLRARKFVPPLRACYGPGQ
jgi:cyanophycinase